jgi:[acyl-carrier-protein] S-malonyltransferase
MQPAAEIMAEALGKVRISAPSVPVVANVLASAVSDPEEIRNRLVEQVTGMVRWRESMLYLKEKGVGTVYEIGSGRVLTGLARRFDGLDARSIGTPEELKAVAPALKV